MVWVRPLARVIVLYSWGKTLTATELLTTGKFISGVTFLCMCEFSLNREMTSNLVYSFVSVCVQSVLLAFPGLFLRTFPTPNVVSIVCCEVFVCAFYPTSFPGKRSENEVGVPSWDSLSVQFPRTLQSPYIPSFNLVPWLSPTSLVVERQGGQRKESLGTRLSVFLPFISQMLLKE